MKPPLINRRDFLKTSTAGMLLATAPTGVLAQGTPAGAPAAGAKTSQWHFRPTEAGAVFRADMSRCAPAANLSRNFESGRWQLIDYETVDGRKGVMVPNPGHLEMKLDNEPAFRRVTLEDGVNTEEDDLKVGVSNFNHKSIQETY